MNVYSKFLNDLKVYEAIYVSAFDPSLSQELNQSRSERLKAQLCMERLKVYSFFSEDPSNVVLQFYVAFDVQCRGDIDEVLSWFLSNFGHTGGFIEDFDSFELIAKKYGVHDSNSIELIRPPNGWPGLWACAIEAKKELKGDD